MRVLALFLLVIAATLPVQAQEPSAEDAAAVEAVIRSQLDAFNRDDGVAAFGYAGPGIQAKFQSVETFMAMVRSGYGPVYRSAAAEFGALTPGDGRLIQEVVVTGQDGKAALAVYLLARQADGSWKIEGVSLQELPDLSV